MTRKVWLCPACNQTLPMLDPTPLRTWLKENKKRPPHYIYNSNANYTQRKLWKRNHITHDAAYELLEAHNAEHMFYILWPDVPQ